MPTENKIQIDPCSTEKILEGLTPDGAPKTPDPAATLSGLKSARMRRSLSQRDLAGEIGVHHQHLNRLEKGKAVPSWDLALKLSRRLGCSLDFLLTGKEKKSA